MSCIQGTMQRKHVNVDIIAPLICIYKFYFLYAVIIYTYDICVITNGIHSVLNTECYVGYRFCHPETTVLAWPYADHQSQK